MTGERSSRTVTFGVPAVMFLSVVNFAQQWGAQTEAQRQNERAETRLTEGSRRIWDALQKEQEARAAGDVHAAERMRDELRQDLVAMGCKR